MRDTPATDNRNAGTAGILGRNAFWLGTATAVSMAASFLYVTRMAAYIGPTEFGRYSLIVAVAGWLVSVGQGGGATAGDARFVDKHVAFLDGGCLEIGCNFDWFRFRTWRDHRLARACHDGVTLAERGTGPTRPFVGFGGAEPCRQRILERDLAFRSDVADVLRGERVKNHVAYAVRRHFRAD